jgi:calcium-dependent protein kinase
MQASLSIDVINNMQNYLTHVNLKKTTLTFIASRIPEDQITNLRQAFAKFDKNGDGKLSHQEIRDGLKTSGIGENFSDEETDKLIKVMDTNMNGFVDYTEFIAACMQSYTYLNESHLKNAFSYFDKDGSGTISKEELANAMGSEDFTLSED